MPPSTRESKETVVPDVEAGVTVVEGNIKNEEPGARWKDDEEHHIPKNNLTLVFLGLMTATFLAAMDQTVVATALPTIMRELSPNSPSAYSWVGAAYLLLASATSPLTGKLSVCFGRKPVLYGAIIFFLFGSALCGAAQNITWLCVCRGVQGIGGGAILVMTQIIVSDIVPLTQRGNFSGIIGATWGIAAVIGPLVGGLLTDHASWRWVFFINLPSGAVSLVLLVFALKLNAHEPITLRTLASTFDFFGLFLIIGGIVLMLTGFNYGETNWGDAKTIGLLVAGGCTLVGAGVWEVKTTKSPIIPPRLFKTRTTACALIGVFFHSFSFISASYYMPLYFQIRGSSATLSGVELLPFSLGSAIISIAGGLLLSWLKKYKGVMIASFALSALGYALLATLDAKSNRAQEEVYLLVAAIGIGSLFQAPIIAIQAAMPLKEMATSTATSSVLRQVGGTAGISIGGAIYASVTRQKLSRVVGYVGVVGVSADVQALHLLEPSELRASVLQAYTRGVSTIWIVCAPILFVALVLSCLLKNYSLERTVIRDAAENNQLGGAEKGKEGIEIEKGASTEETIEQDVTSPHDHDNIYCNSI